MKRIFYLLIASALLLFPQCNHPNDNELFSGFVDPPAEARPFLRWWWNGNHLSADEIIRQLDVLSAAGIGGVEINPIAMPEDAPDIGTKPIVWLSMEWNELLVLAAREAQKRGMIADLIVGSGWPFGGEFLKEDETIQRVIIHKIPFSGGDKITEDMEDLYRKAVGAMSRPQVEQAKSYDLFFIRLVPKDITRTADIFDLTENFRKTNRLIYDVPAGSYDLIYGMLQRSHREVMHGALGAAGPVMNHYDRDVTTAYLNRLKKISEDTGVPLHEILRALFCDSIELAGANWTDGFGDIFFRKYNYRIEPYFPFVFYDPYQGYAEDKYNDSFSDEISRVRYDYNRLLVEVFLDNFTQVFQDFCTENQLICRYQAYGTPFLMGMMEGNLIPDIPESNNWIYSTDMNADEWSWNQAHGYMIWNMYAASGGHLTGRKIISCESMTNTRGVFKTSLDEIKQHDDMNFITGMNHAVLHGYNYSPPEAGFPGWIRYGSYFSEQNPWWPYFSKWVDYNARLSYVFQQSAPVKNIAVLAPAEDIWAENGLARGPFHTQPWYSYRLWEPLSQAGSSCDYISEKIIREGDTNQGKLTFGPMSYQAIILCSVKSLDPSTATALHDFVKNGGRLIMIDEVPHRSLSLTDASANDALVKDVMNQILTEHPDRVFKRNSPASPDDLLPWTTSLLKEINIQTDVQISDPDKNVYQIYKKARNRDMYFFTNSNKVKTVSLDAVFPTGRKTPWIWDPEDGTRKVFPYGKNKNELHIELQPLQSLLLIFDPDTKGKPENDLRSLSGENSLDINGPWQVRFEHVNGNKFERVFETLTNLTDSDDLQLMTFAGKISYQTVFSSDHDAGGTLELEKVNKGLTEVYLNGKQLGVNWYGKPVFCLNDALVKGENHLEIRYTSVLFNYCRSLVDNPVAVRWTGVDGRLASPPGEGWSAGAGLIPVGLEGEVKVLK